MHVLQVGAAKSGNYWLHTVVSSIFREAGLGLDSFIQQHPIYPTAKSWQLSFPEQADIDVIDVEPSGCRFRISSRFYESIPDIDSYIEQSTLVWSHSGFNKTSQFVYPKFDKVIYLVRDPRDVAISLAHFAFTPYMQTHYPTRAKDADEFLRRNLSGIVGNWAKHVGSHLLATPKTEVYFVFYENLVHQFDDELRRLLIYLGLDLSADSRDRIKMETSFETMHAKSPGHVRRGRKDGWVAGLTPHQKQTVARLTGPLLDLLGYPRMERHLTFETLSLSPDFDRSTVVKALRRARLAALQRAFGLVLFDFARPSK